LLAYGVMQFGRTEETFPGKVKAKVTLLCIMKAPREGLGIVLTIQNLCPRKELVVSATPQSLYPREGDAVPIVEEDG